jgi:gluconokinase
MAMNASAPSGPTVVVMGVAGSGKTTIGRQLAGALGVPFVEGDDFHDPENVARMARGEPLTDEMRRPWLDRLNRELHRRRATGVVLACSALTAATRRRLTDGLPDVRFVVLTGDAALLRERLRQRKGHFFDPDLLDSQLATLEIPDDGIVVPIDCTPDEVAERALTGLARG